MLANADLLGIIIQLLRSITWGYTGDAWPTFIEKCLSPFPPFSVFRLFGSEKDSKSMSDRFLPEEVKSAADSVIGDDNPDDGSCLSGVKT